MKKNIKTVADLIEIGFSANKEDEKTQLEFHLVELAEDGKALQDNLAKATAENKDLAKKAGETVSLKAENERLAEQVTALDNALVRAKEASKELPQVSAQLQEKETEINTLKAKLANLEVENQLDKGIAALVFDVNDKARNARMADLCKADWKAQYKVENREELLVVIDKKTQKEEANSVAESIEAFAKENGYTVKAPTGLNISAEVQGVEAASEGIKDITFADKNSTDPKRKAAYQAKKEAFDKDFLRAGGVLNSSKHKKALVEAGLTEAPAKVK